MKRYSIIVLLLISLTSCTQKSKAIEDELENITVGIDIHDATEMLNSYNYKEINLSKMMALWPGEALKFWDLQEGYLIIRYSTKSDKILGVHFDVVSAKNEKTESSFSLEVVSFNPKRKKITTKINAE